MEREKIIQEFQSRIKAYFFKKAVEKHAVPTDLKLVVSLAETGIKIELWGPQNCFVGFEKLATVLNIKIYERLVIDEQQIEMQVQQSIINKAKEINAEPKDVQFMIKENEYHILIHRTKFKQVTLNEII